MKKSTRTTRSEAQFQSYETIDEEWEGASIHERRALIRQVLGLLHHTYISHTGKTLGPAFNELIEAVEAAQRGERHPLFALAYDQLNMQKKHPAIQIAQGMAAAVLEHAPRRTKNAWAARIRDVLQRAGMPGLGVDVENTNQGSLVDKWRRSCAAETAALGSDQNDPRRYADIRRWQYELWSKGFRTMNLTIEEALSTLRTQCNLLFIGSSQAGNRGRERKGRR
jgi:hypothetical protein